MNISCHEVQTELYGLIVPETDKELYINAVKASSLKSIILLGGLSAVLPDIPSVEKKSYLNGLEKLTFDIEVSNQCYASNQLKLWLERWDNITNEEGRVG